MSISSVSSGSVQQRPPVQEPSKGNDHDADDGASSAASAGSQPTKQAPPAPGTGQVVDKTA